ncbi:hypothetical protein ACFE04_010283 [Oxalis oulophora]
MDASFIDSAYEDGKFHLPSDILLEISMNSGPDFVVAPQPISIETALREEMILSGRYGNGFSQSNYTHFPPYIKGFEHLNGYDAKLHAEMIAKGTGVFIPRNAKCFGDEKKAAKKKSGMKKNNNKDGSGNN